LYAVFLQPKASRILKKLKKKAKTRFKAINKSLTELTKDPRNETVPLQDPYFYGLRRARAGDDDRIIFQICEECRNDDTMIKMRKCIDCKDIPDNGVKVFDIPKRKDAYKIR
jgi:mRNA-degrading endonuclease RelE of RelBE toxin-antitoxin system